ncbi:hypothetical protein [Pseudodonghicola xiamenensis]|uniref:Uncharacterized protein n=1 Tax=Pseudodonghicola xiamenensis TaxID=337702 RepID=A0A8J3MC17_9RHOB|nr:hypothetical protein [Pseudodonghicola xiamenensis]GHG88856.1 hypothetical protein GCM10010961_18230 [Pseudodonghicola xiamenensis]
MSAYLIVPLVSLAIAVLAGLLALASRPRRALLDEDRAREAWQSATAGAPIRQMTLSRDRHAALILGDGGPALVWTSGQEVLLRRLLDYDLLDEGKTLRLIFHDYDTPAAVLTLDTSERAHWLNLLNAP